MAAALDLRGKSAALYGRFSPDGRERLVSLVSLRGGAVARDLTRRSHVLVIGACAMPLIANGHLAARLSAARARGLPVYAERHFCELLVGEESAPATLPIATAAAQSGVSADDIRLLAAFDIVRVENEHCRFGDTQTLRTASELRAAGRSVADVVRILARVRDLAPKGRHKIVLGRDGHAELQWESGVTTLEGQGMLPLDYQHATVEEIFEAAEVAEAEEDLLLASRLYDMATRADRRDPIAPYNLGNIKLAAELYDQAVMAYQKALVRDPRFAEARYNLAQAYEAMGKTEEARRALAQLLEDAPDHGDGRFNLAQLELKRGDLAAAKTHYELYLAGDPPADWAAKARKAITYCAAKLAS